MTQTMTQIGAMHVRRSCWIKAPADNIWPHFKDLDAMTAWFGQGHTLVKYEPTVGGQLRLSVDIDGDKKFFGGKICVLTPGAELTAANNWEAEPWPEHTFLTFRLTPLFEGTQVELFHHGFERLGSAAADNLAGYESGWDNRHLETLRTLVESERQ